MQHGEVRLFGGVNPERVVARVNSFTKKNLILPLQVSDLVVVTTPNNHEFGPRVNHYFYMTVFYAVDVSDKASPESEDEIT